MKNITIERYSSEFAGEWDAFTETSRNATFLLKRGFMDYHADRFRDYSLIARSGQRILALLPANVTFSAEGDRILHSHSGLTYGGWILGERHPVAEEMLELMESVGRYAQDADIRALDYKPIPFIYAQRPSQEDLYALFRLGAKLEERNISCVIDMDNNPGFNTQQRRNLKKGLQFATEIKEAVTRVEIRKFHTLLTRCLSERHEATPVHSDEELIMLKERFPKEIRIFMVEPGGEPQAGVCIFDCGTVIHAQYICSSEEGRSDGLLTLLFACLIDKEKWPEARYFDFGTSNEAHGMVLNCGLYRQKSGLGGSGVAYDRYRLSFSD